VALEYAVTLHPCAILPPHGSGHVEHAAFARLQLVAFVPPPLPRHDQVDDPPHDPATFDAEVPALQEY
jgi:hypothetical protein